MNEILIEGQRLRLRRANLADLDYIMTLQAAPENLKFFATIYHLPLKELIT